LSGRWAIDKPMLVAPHAIQVPCEPKVYGMEGAYS